MILVGAYEIAKLLGISRQDVAGRLRYGRLPTPLARLHCGPVWDIEQFREMIDDYEAASANLRSRIEREDSE